MPALPTSIPETLTLGETWGWTLSLPDYPASTWTLKYALQRGAERLALTATAAGDDFALAIPAATTAAYTTPGVYLWTSYVEQGSERHIVARGTVTLLPSPLAALGTSHASRTLALLEAAIENRVPNGLETTNIDGQELQRIPLKDLIDLQKVYQAKVEAEQNRASIAAGLGNRRTIYTRFTPVR
jgi:hypothetical protein